MADSVDNEFIQVYYDTVQVILTWIQHILADLEFFTNGNCDGLTEQILTEIEDEVKEQRPQILVILKEGQAFLNVKPDCHLDFVCQNLHYKWDTLVDKLLALHDRFYHRNVKDCPPNTNNKALQQTVSIPFGLTLKKCSEISCIKSFPCLYSCQSRFYINRHRCPRCNRILESNKDNVNKIWSFSSFRELQDLKVSCQSFPVKRLVKYKTFSSYRNSINSEDSLFSSSKCSPLCSHTSLDSAYSYSSPVEECIRYLEETAPDSVNFSGQESLGRIREVASDPEIFSNCSKLFNKTMSFPKYIPFKQDVKSFPKRRLSEPSRRIHHQDDLWPLIRHDYQYVMDTQLIETCKEANGELSWDDEDLPSTCSCSFTEFINHYKELSDWLNNIQATLSHAEKNGNGKNVRQIKMEEMKVKGSRRQAFNEQGRKLCKRYPEMKDEIMKYLSILNNKWDALEQTITPRKPKRDEESMLKDLDGEIRKLRKWLREVESTLRTQVIKSCWSLAELEERYKAHQILQKDIESHAKIVSSVLQLCERLQLDQRACCSQHDRDSVRQVAVNLERRWHVIWLQSLEWQCRLDHQIGQHKTGFLPPSNLDFCFSYEPVRKCRRLNSDSSVHDHYDASQATSPLSSLSEVRDIIPFSENEYEKIIDTMENDSLDDMPSEFGHRIESYKPPFQDQETATDDILPLSAWLKSTNDKGIMVGSTGIDELKSSTSGSSGRPEIIQDVGYSSESSVHFSNDEKQEVTLTPYGESPVESYEAIVKERTYQIRNSILLTNVTINKLISNDGSHDTNANNAIKVCPDNSLRHLYSSPAEVYYKMTPVDSDCAPESLEMSDSEMGSVLKNQDKFDLNDPIRTQLDFDTLDPESQIINPKTLLKTEFTFLNEEQRKSDSPNFDVSEEWDFSDILPTNKDCSDMAVTDSVQNDKNIISPEILSPLCKSSPINIKISDNGNRLPTLPFDSSVQVNEKSSRPKGSATNNRITVLMMDSSCDASGEYTSNDSDDEESASSDSEDRHKSVILKETVMDTKEDSGKNTKVDSLSIQDHGNKVVLRGKKRRNSDRPLSVTELYQLSNRIDLSPFSISEGALNDLSNSSLNSSYTLLHSLSMEESYKSFNKDVIPSNQNKFRRFKVRGRRFRHSESEGDHTIIANISFLQQNASSGLEIDRSSFSSGNSKLTSSSNKTSLGAELIHQSSSTEKNHSDATAVADTEIETRKHGGIENVASDRLAQSEDICVDSSVSDQVWDNYQDPPYPSDIYSENLDDTEVKKLLDFGDDYRAFLDSQSDAGSARIPILIRKSPTKNRLVLENCKGLGSNVFLADSNGNDSDSDLEDFHHVIGETQGQLQYAESVLNKHSREFSEIGLHLDSQKYAELIATCQTNIKCLQVIAQHIGAEPGEYLDLFAGFVQQWEVLHSQVVDKQKQVRQLQDIQKEIQRLKSIFSDMESRLSGNSEDFSNLQSLENCIKDCQDDCSNLHDHKQALVAANLQLHHLLTANALSNNAHFKSEIELLYLLWESLYEKYRNRTNHLQCLHSKWENYNALCKELLAIFLQKQRKLTLLNLGHDFPRNVAPNVDSHSIQDLERELEDCRTKLEPLEQLSAELLVSLQSEEARQQIRSSWQEVNTELQNLQTKYQELQPRIKNWERPSHFRTSSGSGWISSHHKRFLRRVIYAAVPFQLAIVLLFCLSYLLEPHCCDSLNNYHFSFTPQLRYRHGPPPI